MCDESVRSCLMDSVPDVVKATDASGVAELKTWLRRVRRGAGFTQPQLAKQIGVDTRELFRWERLSLADLPNANQLEALAHAAAAAPRPGLLAVVPPAPSVIADENVTRETPLGPLEDARALKQWIRTVRKQARLSQARLGEGAGVAAITAHKWEHLAAKELPRWHHLEKIAAACGTVLPELGAGFTLRGQPLSAAGSWVGMPHPLLADNLMGEIQQTAQRLGTVYHGRNTQARNEALFVDYYGHGRTLQCVGDTHGLTRERVRQVIARLIEEVPLREPPRARFLELAEHCKLLEPMPVARAEAQLAELLGGVPLSAALTYGAHVLGEGLPIEIDTEQAVPMTLPRGLPNWIPSALRHARRMVRYNGAALFDQVWAATQAEHDAFIAQASIRTALLGVCGFVWLDPTEQWFWFGPDDASNRVLHWARRLLDTAERRVDVEHVLSGLVRFTVRYDETSRTTAVLPTAQVLLTMLGSCPDIEVKQGDDLKLVGRSLAPPAEPGSVLEHVLELLRRNGGVMAYGDIVDELVVKRGIVPVTLTVQLASSPLLRRLDHGIYAIRGWQLSPNSAAAAWRRNVASNVIDVAFQADGSMAWDLTLTESVERVDRLYLPQAVSRNLTPGPLDVRHGGTLRVVGATEHAQICGLGREVFAMGGQVGDCVRISIWPTSRTCLIEAL